MQSKRMVLLSNHPPFLKQAQVAANLMCSFLSISDLNNVTIASNNSCLFKVSFDIKKAQRLLQFVLNSNLNDAYSLIKSSNNIVLLKVSGREEYKYNDLETKEEKVACKREWKSISALEAAAWTGDNLLVKNLLTEVSPDKLYIALSQLEGISKKNNTDENGYLFPFKNLINAYQKAIEQYEKYIEIPKLRHISLETSDKVDRILFEEVRNAQFKLPMHGLQTFCGPTKKLPDLNNPFFGNKFFLSRHFPGACLDECYVASRIFHGTTTIEKIRHDLNFVNTLYKQKKHELHKIINRLRRQLLCNNVTSYCKIM